MSTKLVVWPRQAQAGNWFISCLLGFTALQEVYQSYVLLANIGVFNCKLSFTSALEKRATSLFILNACESTYIQYSSMHVSQR